jgi:membrane-associated phospholipid phosphatase
VDTSLFRWFNDLAIGSTWANGAVAGYASDGIVLFGALLLVSYLWCRHRGDLAGLAGSVWSGAAALAALGVAQMIGALVDRPRPYAALAHVQVLIDHTSDVSFPSDHATTVGAVAVGLWFVDRRFGAIAAVAAVLMAVARVYVGAHYPLDVVAGLVLGGTVAATGRPLVVPVLQRAAERLATSRVAWVVTDSRSATPDLA